MVPIRLNVLQLTSGVRNQFNSTDMATFLQHLENNSFTNYDLYFKELSNCTGLRANMRESEAL